MQALPKKNEELSRIVALVKYNSLFRSLRDVKGTKACFAGYGNVGWNAFVTIMRNISSNQWSCSDAKAVAKFFKHSCVFGLGDKIREVPNNLYSLCTRESQAENDTSAFDCLYSGKAEVAFVDLKVIGKKIGSSVSGNVISIKGAKYRTLCQNNTNINDERICLLTWAPLSSVIAHENITDVRRQEIYLALLEMDQLFGQTFNGQTPAFSLYGNYDSMQNIVFPEETRYLHFEGHQLQGTTKYTEIVERMLKQRDCNGANCNSLLGSLILACFAIIAWNHID